MNEELKASAEAYYRIGANVVPVGPDKRPLCNSWKQWEQARQTQSEFRGLPWSQASGFAVICGAKLTNGLYFAVVDLDVKNLPEAVVAKGKQALRAFPTTQTEQTPSGGVHLVYYSKAKPTTNKSQHITVGLEVLSIKTCCIMAPSTGYTRLNDNAPSEVQDLNVVFQDVLRKCGIAAERLEGPSSWFGRRDFSSQPYKGAEPNCIRELEKGAKQGVRNEYGIRLASYYGNCKQYKTESCLKRLRIWNKLNEPPLAGEEVETLLRSALQGNYTYGCSDPILSALCAPDCPLAKKEKQALTEAEKAQAAKLLGDPDLLDYVVGLGRKRLIGEDNLLKQNFLYVISGQTRYPLSEVITGHSGSGKNESIRAVSPLIPEGWIFEFTTSTPEAIKYIPEGFCGTLIIYELAGIRSETGTLGLRSIGEGKGIKTIYPMRDEETGKMVLGETQTNAKNFISTDSGLDVAADLYRRVFKNSMNDSLALTKRVCAKKMRDAALPESLRVALYPEQVSMFSETDFKNALSLLNLGLEVVLFPPDTLLKLIDLANKKEQQVALRTQIERILNVVKILALLYQNQRIHVTLDKIEYVVADAEDVVSALKLLETSIMETVTRIEKRQKEALEIIEASSSALNKHELTDKMSCSTVTAARILKSLAKNGYLKELQTAKPYKYEATAATHSNPLVFSDMISKYILVYPERLRNFLNSTLSSHHAGGAPIFSFTVPDDLQKKYAIATVTSDKVPSSAESSLNGEASLAQLVFSELKSENSAHPLRFEFEEKSQSPADDRNERSDLVGGENSG